MRRLSTRLATSIATAALLATWSNTASGFSLFGPDEPAKPQQTDQTPSQDVKAGGASYVKTLEQNLDTELATAHKQRVSGDLVGASHTLIQLLIVAPDDGRVVGEYGKVLVAQGHTEDAIAFLKRALELKPDDWALYSAIGVAYDQKNDYADAKLAFDRGLLLKPDAAPLLNNYAMSKMLSGDLPAAQSLMARAEATGSADPKITSNAALLAGLRGSADTQAHPAPVAMTKPATKSAATAQAASAPAMRVAAADRPVSAIEKTVIRQAEETAAEKPIVPLHNAPNAAHTPAVLAVARPVAAQPKLAPSSIAKPATAPSAKIAATTTPATKPETAPKPTVKPMAVATAAPKPAPASKQIAVAAVTPEPLLPVTITKAVDVPATLSSEKPVTVAVAAPKTLVPAAITQAPKTSAAAPAPKMAHGNMLPTPVTVASLSAPVIVNRPSGRVMMQRVPLDPKAGPVGPDTSAPAEKLASNKADNGDTHKKERIAAVASTPAATSKPMQGRNAPPQLRTAAD